MTWTEIAVGTVKWATAIMAGLYISALTALAFGFITLVLGGAVVAWWKMRPWKGR